MIGKVPLSFSEFGTKKHTNYCNLLVGDLSYPAMPKEGGKGGSCSDKMKLTLGTSPFPRGAEGGQKSPAKFCKFFSTINQDKTKIVLE